MRRDQKMKKLQIYLTNKQVERLGSLAEDWELPASELVRRALDYWLDNVEGISCGHHVHAAE